MPNTTAAPKKMVKAFLKAIDAFMHQHDIPKTADQARVLNVRDATLRDWRSGRRSPTPETIARVSNDLAAVERFLSIPVRLS